MLRKTLLTISRAQLSPHRRGRGAPPTTESPPVRRAMPASSNSSRLEAGPVRGRPLGRAAAVLGAAAPGAPPAAVRGGPGIGMSAGADPGAGLAVGADSGGAADAVFGVGVSTGIPAPIEVAGGGVGAALGGAGAGIGAGAAAPAAATMNVPFIRFGWTWQWKWNVPGRRAGTE